MDQNSNNNQNGFLWSLLANPANDAHLYLYNLQRLVSDFPQSGVLQALLAHASDEKNLKRASVYFNSQSLYKLINTPSALNVVTEEKIVKQTYSRANGHVNSEHFTMAESPEIEHGPQTDAGGSDVYFSEYAEVETEAAETKEIEHQPAAEQEAALDPVDDEINEPHLAEADNFEDGGHLENANIAGHSAPPLMEELEQNDEELEQGEAAVTSNEPPGEQTGLHTETNYNDPEREIDNSVTEHISVDEPRDVEDNQKPAGEFTEDHTYDEIVNPEQIVTEPKPMDVAVEQEEENAGEMPDMVAPTDEKEQVAILPGLNDEEEKLIVENIAATDFFMFDRAFGERQPVGPAENIGLVSNAGTAEMQAGLSPDAEHQDISKYHDEEMPYTFMWWLDKTRKEHAGIYQPYVKPETSQPENKKANNNDELQQQYFENIFHITSVDELEKIAPPRAVKVDIKRKEHVIIERFIQEEPQIRPQSSDKLDNENKAKKSSEDRDELVTETLAGIYTEQMLYHKAIASYKKLMLKFPEKSRYFASKIEQLEKKTN